MCGVPHSAPHISAEMAGLVLKRIIAARELHAVFGHVVQETDGGGFVLLGVYLAKSECMGKPPRHVLHVVRVVFCRLW